MKTRFFAAFVAAMMTTMSMNATMTENGKKNTTATPDNDLPGVTVVAKRTVEFYNADKTRKSEYNIDALGRVSSKVNYVGTEAGWHPISAYSVFYGDTETILTYAEYNPANKTFTKNAKQSRFDASEYPVLIKVPQVK